jgi:hypothetical protein
VAWNGAGGWLIFSQSRQLNFSRTVWITFHCVNAEVNFPRLGGVNFPTLMVFR